MEGQGRAGPSTPQQAKPVPRRIARRRKKTATPAGSRINVEHSSDGGPLNQFMIASRRIGEARAETRDANEEHEEESQEPTGRGQESSVAEEEEEEEDEEADEDEDDDEEDEGTSDVEDEGASWREPIEPGRQDSKQVELVALQAELKEALSQHEAVRAEIKRTLREISGINKKIAAKTRAMEGIADEATKKQESARIERLEMEKDHFVDWCTSERETLATLDQDIAALKQKIEGVTKEIAQMATVGVRVARFPIQDPEEKNDDVMSCLTAQARTRIQEEAKHILSSGTTSTPEMLSLIGNKVIEWEDWNGVTDSLGRKTTRGKRVTKKCKLLVAKLTQEWREELDRFRKLTPALCQQVAQASSPSDPLLLNHWEVIAEIARGSRGKDGLGSMWVKLVYAIAHVAEVDKLPYSKSSETWLRVNVWGPLFDVFLRDTQGIVLRREQKATATAETRNVVKRPDVELVSEARVVLRKDSPAARASLLIAEEKPDLDSTRYQENTQTQMIPFNSYRDGNADRYKLVRMMRDALVHRCAGSPSESSLAGSEGHVQQESEWLPVMYGVQWVGTRVWVLAMVRCYADFSLLVKLGRYDLLVHDNHAEILRSVLALRNLVSKQLAGETQLQGKERDEGVSVTTSTPLVEDEGEGEDEDEDDGEEVLEGRGAMRFCPPVPLWDEEGLKLPGNRGRYQVLARLGDHMWSGRSSQDGRHVVLKRLWVPVWDALRELMIHQRVSKVRGVAPLLDFFCENSGSAVGMGGYLVLVLPMMRPLVDPVDDPFSVVSIELDAMTVLRIARSLASTLDVLHREHGIVHFDVKPHNLLLPPAQPTTTVASDDDSRSPSTEESVASPVVYLCDFGESRTIHHRLRFALGTSRYMAPEVSSVDEHRRAALSDSKTDDSSDDGDDLKVADEVEEEGIGVEQRYPKASGAMDMWSFGRTLQWLLEQRTVSNESASQSEDRSGSVIRVLNEIVALCLDYQPGNRPTAKRIRDLLLEKEKQLEEERAQRWANGDGRCDHENEDENKSEGNGFKRHGTTDTTSARDAEADASMVGSKPRTVLADISNKVH